MSGDGGREGCLDPQVWVSTHSEAPKPWEMSISHGKEGYRLIVGPGGSGQSINLSASVRRLCEFSATFGTCQIPEEATAGWLVCRQKGTGAGSWGNEPSPYSGQAALWRMAAFRPPSFSRGRVGWVLYSDPLHPWVPGMEKLRAGGVGEVPFVMRGHLPPSTSLPGQRGQEGNWVGAVQRCGAWFHPRSVPGKGCPGVIPPVEVNDARLRVALQQYETCSCAHWPRPCVPWEALVMPRDPQRWHWLWSGRR